MLKQKKCSQSCTTIGVENRYDKTKRSLTLLHNNIILGKKKIFVWFMLPLDQSGILAKK